MPLSAGHKLGEYEIVRPIGAGGMGEVYRARDARLNRDVAIKVLPEFASSNLDRLLRFEQEARAAAALNHPNILAVYQMGTYEGVPYLVTELLEGETLKETLSRGPLPLSKVIAYGVQIAHGLAAAHDKGIVHRDLKPDNLFISKDGRVKILDFGLARIAHQEDSAESSHAFDVKTRPGVLLGTVAYMSPEQVRGQVADHRSDIFAFSAILREMLSGRRPFQKPTQAETMSAILHEDLPALAELPSVTPLALQKILQRGLQKNPDQRFQSASDMAFALEALSDPALLSHVAVLVPADSKPDHRRAKWVAITLAVVLGLGAFAYLVSRPAPAPRVSNYVQLTQDGVQKSLIGTDGSRLYLSLITSALQGVASIPISGGEPTKIPMPGSGMVPVALSPDGSQFLVVDGQGVPFTGPLWSLPVLGGSPRRLGDTVGTTAAWSPDGRRMVYANSGDIFLANADGTQPAKLLTMNGLVADPAWSLDGSTLRFSTSDGFGPGIGQHLAWEVSPDGSNLHRLFAGWHNPPDECCGSWTANGKYFVFQSQGQIWALPRQSTFSHAEPKPIQLTSSPMSLHSPIPGKDGKKLFVVGRTYRGELTRYDPTAHQFLPFLGGVSAEYVAFSKDGQWVAYVTYPEGSLWKAKADGSERLQLTFPPFKPVLPRWSPDGNTIVFFEFPVSSSRPARIYELPSAGGSPRPLMPDDPRNQQDPNWSPDGNRIVFAGDATDAVAVKGAPAISVFDRQTRQVSPVPGSQGLFSPRWSPDGQHLSALSSDSSAVLVFDFQTKKWTQVAKGTFGWLNWSRDGKSIYILDFTGDGSVARIRIGDGRVEQVVGLKNFVTTGQFGGTLSLAPDDSPLLLRDRGTQDVYALDWEEP
jgi:serine/threonine protein kinase/Tol biopolymer transport system component